VKGVTLDLTVEPDLPAVRGVVGELNQVWLNLVDNAIDAAPENGRVSVRARRERGAVVVSVIDDGAGVSEQDRGRVFDPFFTTKPVGQGTGLGLDVVQAVVRSHGGSVQMDSSRLYRVPRVPASLAGLSAEGASPGTIAVQAGC
ncbi:MAG: ATP-binding protein, partial [Gemmatimonadetes bacterium]|nr:ATP-binding protein [Gemmatimonadota bacterium]